MQVEGNAFAKKKTNERETVWGIITEREREIILHVKTPTLEKKTLHYNWNVSHLLANGFIAMSYFIDPTVKSKEPFASATAGRFGLRLLMVLRLSTLIAPWA